MRPWIAVMLLLLTLRTAAVQRALLAIPSTLDFVVFVDSARRYFAGHPMYFASKDTMNWLPPIGHLLILPFAALPVPVGLFAWNILGFCCVLLCVWLIGRELMRRPPQWMYVALLAGAPVQASLVGQWGWILLVPLTFTWLAVRREQWLRGGMWIGILIALKPFLAPLGIWLVLRRQWTASLAAAASGLAATALGGVIFGWPNLNAWLRQLVSERVTWADHVMNASVAALAPPGTDPLSTVWFPLAALAILVIGLYAGYRIAPGIAVGIVAFASILASPLGWVYYWWLMLPSVAEASVRRARWQAWKVAGLVAWVWPPELARAGWYAALSIVSWILFVAAARHDDRVPIQSDQEEVFR